MASFGLAMASSSYSGCGGTVSISEQGRGFFDGKTNSEVFYHYSTESCNTLLLRNIEELLAQNTTQERAGVSEWTFLHMDETGLLTRKPKPTKGEDVFMNVVDPPNVTVTRSKIKAVTTATTEEYYMLVTTPAVGTCALVNLIASEISVNRQVAPRIKLQEFITEKLRVIRHKYGVWEARRWQQIYSEQLPQLFVPLSFYQLMYL